MTIKKSNLYKIVFFLLYIPLLTRFFTDNFGMSYVIMPLFDIVLIVLLLMILYFYKSSSPTYVKKTWLFLLIIVCVVIVSEISSGGTSYSNLFYQIRPYLRMTAMIVAASYILKIKDLEYLYKGVKYLLYLNVVIMLFQYLFLGLRQDIIGGTFGNNQGVNAIQNVLCIFLFTASIIKYLYKEIRIKELLLNVFSVLTITILAEINFLLFEILIIAVLALFICKKRKKRLSPRKLFLIISGVITAILGIYLFLKINPDRAFLFSTDAILEYIGAKEGSTGVYRISRVGVFSQLGTTFFGEDALKWFLGMGVGNCSTHSLFYSAHRYLQYENFSSSLVFLETGLLGVFCKLGILIYLLIRTIKENKCYQIVELKAWNNICIILVIMSLLLFFYNSSLRDMYTAFWIGVFCSIGIITKKEVKQ